MNKIKIGLFGFGVVGQGIFQVLSKSRNAHAEIVKICVRSNKPRSIDASYFTTDPEVILSNPEIDLIVEVIDDAAASYKIVKAALQKGIPVVSGNKAMLARPLPELIDRYGSPPKSVQGLVDVSLVRVTAARVGIAEIVQRGDQLILYSDIVGPKQLGEVMEKFPHRVLYNALGRPYFSLRVQKGESPLVLLRDVVTLLPGAQNQPQTNP